MSDTVPDPSPRASLEAVRDAMDLMARAETWPQLREALEAAGLTRRLGADGMQRLADLWRARLVRALGDAALLAEIRVWAEGGDYATHPDGFLAPPPADLAAEAARRGWFVRALASGGWVLTPPATLPGAGGPLTLPDRR
ncbi:hypothetical protein [Roseospira visakhapatnamensis]|uniref:Uncharacterized protein n=1 Tax=Roseospira visakhapatnamensis TaxID=390880 RepID=A0A7W6WBA2_9PROT|nr:hypothetical protein [Roseospira visakhapatnamensis]MBB4267306.1 hypothetical protein [Roseospira visakhapatnamensis]